MEKYVNAHSFPAAKRNAGWKIQPSKTTKQTKPEKNQSVDDVGKKKMARCEMKEKAVFNN